MQGVSTEAEYICSGKTSLCKALAQKLSIHLSDRYTYGQLLEINSHSLFSKWFSESGKLVQKMFDKIQVRVLILICVFICNVMLICVLFSCNGC